MKTTKWFYKFQDLITAKIEAQGYTHHGYINFQLSNKDTYIESWFLGKDGKVNPYIIVCHRQTGFIFIYQDVNTIKESCPVS